jgi:hypothetical protein
MPTKEPLTSDTFGSRTGLGAKRKAIKNWRQKAKATYGEKYSHWWRAKSRERYVSGPSGHAIAYVVAKPYCRNG